ncbi:MAG: DUF6671 family protein [Cyanobacteria bacterium J06638_22]
MSQWTGKLAFENRVLVIATMHRKEEAIAPPLEAELGVQIQVPDNFNSDSFGTFTRDVDRPADQLETARLKLRYALELTGADLGVSSEGSFGPHPMLPMLPLNRELVLLIDQAHHLELVGEATTTETNYSHATVKTLAEAQAFAKKARFPSHGLVAMPSAEPEDRSLIHKGITSEADLLETVEGLLSQFGQAHLETDVRAMVNPTRMQAIAQATHDLLRKLKQRCPNCGYPGFEIGDRQPGLPCGLCGLPTDLTLTAIYHCQNCGYEDAIIHPDGITAADPAQCPFCNP